MFVFFYGMYVFGEIRIMILFEIVLNISVGLRIWYCVWLRMVGVYENWY